jgi:hypothetical protein
VCRLVSTYKKHAARLRRTGGGIQGVGADNRNEKEETMEFYIPWDGPDESTSVDARNIWGRLCTTFSDNMINTHL